MSETGILGEENNTKNILFGLEQLDRRANRAEFFFDFKT